MQLATIKNAKLELNTKTLECMGRFPKNTKWVVVHGVARGGKSTLCNLLNKSTAFTVSNEAIPCTNGVWISNPMEITRRTRNEGPERPGIAYDRNEKEGEKEKEYLVVVDSEGTDMGDTTHQHKILTLACLLACDGGVMVHNEKHYANTAIQAQAFIATGMKLVKGLEKQQLPFLCFLVRNFDSVVTVNKTPATLDQFYDYLLSDNGDKIDTQRKLIRESFPRKTMFTTAPLTKKEQSHLASQTLAACSFLSDFEKFEEWLYNVLEPKKVGGLVCDGPLMVSFLERAVSAINAGEGVEMPNVLEETMDVVCSQRSNLSLQTYKDGMALQNIAEVEDIRLQELHNQNLEKALSLYTTNTTGFYAKSANRFLDITKKLIAQEFTMITTNHTDLRAKWLATKTQTEELIQAVTGNLSDKKLELDIHEALKQVEKQVSATWKQVSLAKVLEEYELAGYLRENFNLRI